VVRVVGLPMQNNDTLLKKQREIAAR